MDVTFACASCGSTSDAAHAPWRCPCGAPWEVDRSRPVVLPDLAPVTMGEGRTPLVSLDANRDAWLKLEYVAPTLSFKDRGAVVLAAAARETKPALAVVDSSGNAGAAAAAYMARAGVRCEVYVPESARPGKLAAIGAYGAPVHRVAGDRGAVAAAAQAAVEESGAFYASHMWNPLFLEGTRRFAEELTDPVPDAVVVPFGSGSLLLGAAIGFRELAAAGRIEQQPRLYGIRPSARPTIADGAAVDDPPRRARAAEAVNETGGDIVDVPEDAIGVAVTTLGWLGIWAEPTAALGLAGYLELSRELRGRVVVAVTGSGAKAS